tara:strand:+ start:71 stop:241 length:171 start_codon:yes stop_codon:yes gene_type:complete
MDTSKLTQGQKKALFLSLKGQANPLTDSEQSTLYDLHSHFWACNGGKVSPWFNLKK